MPLNTNIRDRNDDREMTMSELATYELEGRIATITMDDGKVNAFSIDMLRAA
jgi:enoyl-CoA hydratase/carnithine racemase